MKIAAILKYSIMSLLLLLQLDALAQVNISVQILPPYPTKFTDYASRPQLMIISLTNTGTTPQKVQLRGAVTGDNGISIRSKPGYKSNSPIELAAGQTRTLNGNDIAFFFNYTDLQYAGITQTEFVNKGGLPEGRYQLCIRAFDYDNNQPLSQDEPAGCSNTFSISSLEPPVILSPMADQVIPSGPGQVFSIRWNTPPSTPPGIQYRIRMVEIIGDRNPNDAIMTATQPYFFEKEVMTNMYIYNPADPQLTPGRKYALMVEAFDPFNNAVFRNNGRSEVVGFSYEQTVPQPEVVIVQQDTLAKKPVIVKGKLKYRFPESPEAGIFSIKQTKVYLEKVYVQESASNDTTASSWKPINAALAGKLPFLTDPVDGVLAQTDNEGNFELKLGMTVLDSAGMLSPYHRQLLGLDQRGLVNSAPKQTSTRLSTANVGIMYRLRISNPHFKPYDEYLRIVPGDTINLQQRIVDANSYLLKVNVAESFNGKLGAAVQGAKVRIYRQKADKLNPNLGIPFVEGDLLDSTTNWKTFGSKVLIAEAITPTSNQQQLSEANTITFKRLFRNLADDGYQYLISLEKGEQVLAQMSFDELTKLRTAPKKTSVPRQPSQAVDGQDSWISFSYNQQPDTAKLTLHKELTAAPRSQVTGILKYRFKYYSGMPDQPYANMKVSLRSSTDMKSVVATTTTDGTGRFVFDFTNIDSTYTAVQATQNGMGKRVYFVVPEVKYYAIPNDEILVQPWGNYDCGELVSLVQTYALKITAEGENKEPVPQAEVLVLRYRPEIYKDILPNLPELNLQQEISFGNGNATTNNYTVGNGQSAPTGNSMSATVAIHINGETTNRQNQFILQRKLYTEANGSTVLVKGLIPSIDLSNDRYQIRVGSADRSSNSVAYETTIFDFPLVRWIAPPEIRGMDREKRTIEGLIQGEKDKLYDPTWGYQNNAQFDPAGGLIMPGLGMNSVTQTSNGVLGTTIGATGNTINKVNPIKNIGGGRLGYAIHQSKTITGYTEWKSLAKNIQIKSALKSNKPVVQKREFGPIVSGPLLLDTALLFNNQLPSTEPVYEELVTVIKKDARIAGRVIDSISKLGVKNVQIAVLQKVGRLDQTFGSTAGDDNGDFSITPATMAQYGSTFYNPEKDAMLGIYSDGYKSKYIPLGVMTKGKQYYNEQIILEPLGTGMYGYVIDKDEPRRAVPARIKMIDNGMWVNTAAYSGQKHRDNMNSSYDPNEEVRDQQRFLIDLPTTRVKLVIMPYDRAYLTDTIEVNVQRGNLFLGMIPLTARKHKVRIQISHEKDQLVPALITLVENEMRDTIMETLNGKAYFEFVNNATKNFTIHVKPLGNTPISGKKMFVPQTFTLQNEDDGKEKHYSLEVAAGRLVTGSVTFNTGEKAVGAKVYLESGSGGSTDNFTLTNSQGAYSIVLPILNISQYTMRANYFEEGKTYVSAEKVVAPEESKVDLMIKKVEGIDVSRILGFKTRINTLKEDGAGTYTISGELYDIPVNANFSSTDSLLNRNLVFTNIKIKTSAVKNAAGIPMAVPIDNTILTDNSELAVKVNKAFNGIMHGADELIVINKATTDTSGTIVGKVRILDNSFQFPSSYMRMESTDFYLGVRTGAESMNVFSSAQNANVADRFLLTTKQGVPISFKYLGFKGVAETLGERSSNLQGETIHLFMNLSTTLPGNIPLTLKAGEARISKGNIGKIITTDSLSFKLENWNVTTKISSNVTRPGWGSIGSATGGTWELSPSSGGLVIKKGEIVTSKLNIPFKNMTIIPNEEGFPGDLVCPDLMEEGALNNANFTIGGIAKLKMKTGAKSMFIYDPGVGRDGSGHYKLSITSSNYNDYAASFSGLDGMTNPGEAYKIQIISMLSNGEELFGFVNNQSITYYNQVKFMPQTLSSTGQNSFSIAGSIDLGIPSMNTKFFESLIYTKNGSKNKVTLPVFDFNFIGQGDVKFTAIATKEAQQFRPEGFVIAGNLALPGGVNLKGGKLIAMVTAGAKDLLDPNGLSSALPSGTSTEVKREIDVLFGSKEKAEEFLKDIKDEVDAKIATAKQELLDVAENAVKNEVTKLIPMGEDAAKGALGDLAGAWKLGNTTFKQGQDIAAAVKDGNFMKVAGLMKNLPGVNEALQDAKNAVVMEAKNSLNAIQEKLPEFKDVPISGNGFEPGNFEFDLKNGRIFGSITFKAITLGAVGLRNGGMEMLFDRGGWYFCSGATMDIPVPILTPLKVGILIGNYGAISDEIEGRVTKMAQSVSGQLPPAVKRGLSGFFIVGGKPIADVDVGFGIAPIAEFKLVASIGAEVRTYALFGKGSFTMGLGALAYGRVYASASGLGVSVTGGAEVNVAIASTVTVSEGNIGLCAQGCVSVSMFLEACALGQCGSVNAGIMALLNLGVGDDGILRNTGCGKSGVGFSISTGGGSCVNNPSFDF